MPDLIDGGALAEDQALEIAVEVGELSLVGVRHRTRRDPRHHGDDLLDLRWTDGVVEQVTDQEIMDAKALIDGQGIGCEPASACSLAATRKLVEQGVIRPGEMVVGTLTGHILKDPDATIGYHSRTLDNLEPAYSHPLHQAEPSVDEIARILQGEPVVT